MKIDFNAIMQQNEENKEASAEDGLVVDDMNVKNEEEKKDEGDDSWKKPIY